MFFYSARGFDGFPWKNTTNKNNAFFFSFFPNLGEDAPNSCLDSTPQLNHFVAATITNHFSIRKCFHVFFENFRLCNKLIIRLFFNLFPFKQHCFGIRIAMLKIAFRWYEDLVFYTDSGNEKGLTQCPLVNVRRENIYSIQIQNCSYFCSATLWKLFYLTHSNIHLSTWFSTQ